MVAEAGAVTDPGHTGWADGVQVSFVQREVRAAKVAGLASALTGRTAGRASHHRGVVGLGAVDPQDGPTETAKPRSFRELAGVVLPIAVGAGHEKSHERKNGATELTSQSDFSQPSCNLRGRRCV